MQEIEGNNNLQVGGDLTVNVGNKEAIVTARLLRVAYILFAASIISTSLPHQGINVTASLVTVFLFLLICTLSWDLRRAGDSSSFKKQKMTALALILTSITTGCAGPMLARVPDPAIIDLVKDYKSGVATGVGILGFGLDEITAEAAARNGGIEEIYFADQVRGYGLISYAQVSVFGE